MRAIEQALREAEQQGIIGKAVTPFVLARVKDITGGASLTANVALVVNNARVGAEIAVAYADVAKRRQLIVGPTPTDTLAPAGYFRPGLCFFYTPRANWTVLVSTNGPPPSDGSDPSTGTRRRRCYESGGVLPSLCTAFVRTCVHQPGVIAPPRRHRGT